VQAPSRYHCPDKYPVFLEVNFRYHFMISLAQAGTIPAGNYRHKVHRFEWSREQFQTWAEGTLPFKRISP
jgi:hypothetical protein